jgi:hypothetical protein
MADVACFCGYLFSFDGGAGACPRCGEVAGVTGLAVPGGSGRSRPGTPDAEIRQLSRCPVPAIGQHRLDQTPDGECVSVSVVRALVPDVLRRYGALMASQPASAGRLLGDAHDAVAQGGTQVPVDQHE